MARKRLVAPQFFKHGELFDAEKASGFPIRVAFEGLWVVSDRRGIFEWRPREMKLEILPYDDLDFADVLAVLLEYDFIRTYEVNGKQYGIVPSFDRWQTFHRNEAPSDCPAPPDVATKPSTGGDEPSNGRPSTPVTGTVAVTVANAITGAGPIDMAGGTPPGTTPPVDRSIVDLRLRRTANRVAPDEHELAQLRAAATIAENRALDILLAKSDNPYGVVGEIFSACTGSGKDQLRGKFTGNAVTAAHALRAVAEMGGNGMRWNVSLFRGCAQRVADRKPQTPDQEERRLLALNARIDSAISALPSTVRILGADGCAISVPFVPFDGSGLTDEERTTRREAAMAQFAREMGMSRERDPALVWPKKYEHTEGAQA